MIEVLTTQGVAYRLEKLITGAGKHLTLISPFLQLSKILFERQQDADRRGVPILMVYGKSELDGKQCGQLATLKQLKLHFHETCTPSATSTSRR